MRRIFKLSIFICLLDLASCFSLSRAPDNAWRRPAGASYPPGVYDAFSEEGYRAIQRRKMAPGAALSEAQINQELAGREIWFKSAPNGRYHTYVFNQRVNAPIDWYRVLRTDQRENRLYTWGMINDPDCCTPGEDCEKRGIRTRSGRAPTLADTYGLDYCPGDEDMWPYIGRSDLNYLNVDPACTNPAVKAADLGRAGLENPCQLAFGVSAGAVGYRKFPNPRFNPKHWKGWAEYEKRDFEGSTEPPVHIAISCATCHAAYDPVHPPADPRHPQWNNISGTIGNQYTRISEIFASGARRNSFEWQMFVPMSRPGTTDTSAVPNDLITNPGTMNAIINLPVRPTFANEVITRWRPVSSCDPSVSSCEAVTYNKDTRSAAIRYWEYATKTEPSYHMLKGGEDSAGADLAVQRVYASIGLCAETCWFNHQTNLRAFSPHERGFKQTPFDIGQCRRDCPAWRANEDRVPDILAFLKSGRPFDLKDALVETGAIRDESEFTPYVENRFGGSVNRGAQIFATTCTGCHSSQNENKIDLVKVQQVFDPASFKKEITLPSGEIIRADFMSNDKSVSAAVVGTYKCRALHTNHKKGHVWEEFGSDSYRAKPGTMKDAQGKVIAGGPGYYRPASLLSVWATAPLMHNNAIGPEVCGNKDGDPFHFNTYVGQQTNPDTVHKCDLTFDPSVEGRLTVFDQSLDRLFTPPSQRPPKLSVATEDILIPLGLSLKSIGGPARKFYLQFKAGTPVARIGNLDFKNLAGDIAGSLPYYDPDDDEKFDTYWSTIAGESCGPRMARAVRQTLKMLASVKSLKGAGELGDDVANGIYDNSDDRLSTYEDCYSNCTPMYENAGHAFGTGKFTEQDKKDLKAFLSTL